MKLEIPFYSQLNEEIPKELQRSVCAIACVKMILDSRDITVPFMDLCKEGEIVGGKQATGWNHETIVRLLRNHGLLAYRQEFVAHTIDLDSRIGQVAAHSSRFVEEGITKIQKSIDEGRPVIASVLAGFSQDPSVKKSLNMESHVVLITGSNEAGLYVHDPLFVDGAGMLVSFEHFTQYWRKFAIFVE